MGKPGDCIRRRDQVHRYDIRMEGHLDIRAFSDWLDHLAIQHEPDGTSTLTCPPIDQATVHGLLNRIRDLGLPIVSFGRTVTGGHGARTEDHQEGANFND